jgi:hypothetical protein
MSFICRRTILRIKSIEKRIETYFYVEFDADDNFRHSFRRSESGNWEAEYSNSWEDVGWSDVEDLEKLFQEHLHNNP